MILFAVILLASNALVFQLGTLTLSTTFGSGASSPLREVGGTASVAIAGAVGRSIHGPGIPPGGAEALPSIRTSKVEDAKIRRGSYGGEGDGKHLGGFTTIDLHGISPWVWKLMITELGVKSVLDVGCGKGTSASWFALHGAEVLCVEGSHDAVTQSLLPDPATQVVEHDFSRGPWWPAKTYDAVWCVEFTEHVGRNYQQNYVTSFRKAAFIFVTHSHWGGWHHVEIHSDDWWRTRFESYGFVYSEILTKNIRDTARKEKGAKIQSMVEGQHYNPQHLFGSMLVFINPAVASLPEHQHLLAEHGCFGGKNAGGAAFKVECGSEEDKAKLTPLSAEYKPLPLDQEMDNKWEALVKGSLSPEYAAAINKGKGFVMASSAKGKAV